MSELTSLLYLYKGDFKKFDKAVKKQTKKKMKAEDIIYLARSQLVSYESDLVSGALRKAQTAEQIYDLIKLGKNLIGKEVFRVWNGGKNGKICSKVTVKSIEITGKDVILKVQAQYSANVIKPVVREINLEDLGILWFLTEKDCKEAISRM